MKKSFNKLNISSVIFWMESHPECLRISKTRCTTRYQQVRNLSFVQQWCNKKDRLRNRVPRGDDKFVGQYKESQKQLNNEFKSYLLFL